MFTRYRVSSNNNSSKEDSDTRETSNLSGLHQAHASEPPLGCWGNWAAASGAGASPSLGRRGARAQQAGPGAQRRSSSESLFPAREFGEHRARETPAIGGELRGRHREHRWAAGPSGAAASARGSGPTGQPGGRASSTGAPRPGHPRGSRRRTPRAAAPLAPRLARTSPRLGTPQLGGCAGRAREFPGRAGAGRAGGLSPGSASPAPPAGLPRPPPPPRAAHPGRARAARRSLRELRTEPGPRSPLTEAAAARGRRSASLPPSQVSRALRPHEATGAAHGRAGAGLSSACAAVAVASRVRGSAAMSARLTLSASLAARPPQPRSSLRRRLRGGRVPPLAAPRHSALQPSFLTLFCPSLPLSPGPSAHPEARRSRGAHPASAGLLASTPGGGPAADRP